MKPIILSVAIGVVFTYFCAGNPAQIPTLLIAIASVVLIVMLVGTAANYYRNWRVQKDIDNLVTVFTKSEEKQP